MERNELVEIMGRAAYAYPNLTLSDPFIDSWLDRFKNYSAAMFSKALEMADRENTTGFFPSPGQVFAKLNLIEKVKRTKEGSPYWVYYAVPDDAASGLYDDKLIVRECWNYARFAIPDIDGSRQFDSPEEMEKSIEINYARQRRAFIERFTDHQTKIKAFVDSGMCPKIATFKALESSSTVHLSDALFERAQAQLGIKKEDPPEEIMGFVKELAKRKFIQ
jgi:hypothetical protein